MLGPTRPFPRVGASARIKHFGGSVELGTVVAVHDDGARVSVRTITPHDGGQVGTLDDGERPEGHTRPDTGRQADGSDGELYEFVLSPANARFVSAGDAHGPRLELVD